MQPIPRSSQLLGASPLALVASLALLGEAAAEPTTPAASSSPSAGFSVGLNLPFGWYAGNLAASTSFGFRRHHAVRANFATYHPIDSETGLVYDFGAAWVYYPRALWSGPMVEVGALLRSRDLAGYESDDFDDLHIETDTRTYAGRALGGWTWRLDAGVFFAAALGFSVGYERGEESKLTNFDDMPTHSNVSRLDGAFEFYLRFGLVFDD
jgi:hypothetical protein